MGILRKVNIMTGQIDNVYKYNKGTKNPLHFDVHHRNQKVEVVFGDYGGKNTNGDVGIYRYTDDSVTEIASIPGNLINHIHMVKFDAWRDCYWVFTGDSDDGSAIYGGWAIRVAPLKWC